MLSLQPAAWSRCYAAVAAASRVDPVVWMCFGLLHCPWAAAGDAGFDVVDPAAELCSVAAPADVAVVCYFVASVGAVSGPDLLHYAAVARRVGAAGAVVCSAVAVSYSAAVQQSAAAFAGAEVMQALYFLYVSSFYCLGVPLRRSNAWVSKAAVRPVGDEMLATQARVSGSRLSQLRHVT